MIRPTDLRVDDDPQPLALDHAQPAFSWIPASAERGQTQSGYRLLVASSPERLAADNGDRWDSGRVRSAATYAIPYGGRALRSVARYFWKVRLWDRAESPSGWSAPAEFGAGILPPDAWQAQWIGRGAPDEPRVDVATGPDVKQAEARHGPISVDEGSDLLRREWSLPKPARRAVALVCGLGFYELHINGRRVGRNVLTPSKTDYRRQVLYDAYDVTDLLREGANAVGLHLGNGWYNPVKEFWDWHMQWHGSKRALLQLHVEYADGTSDVRLTDGAWRASAGPMTFNCLYGGEIYDARLEQPGWDRPGFDDSRWQTANIVAAPGGVLHYHALEPIQVIQAIRPAAMWEAAPGVYLFDLGQNFSGFVRLRVRGPRGAQVSLRHAENIHPDGTLDPLTNMRARNNDIYILKGEGAETYQPRFTYHGFRYVEMTGFPGAPALDAIEGRVIHSACRQTGEFRCANELINHIHHCTVWSQRSNMMGLPTDDNQRDERLGWMGDGHLAAEECLCNFDAVRFYRKWLRDMKHGQNPDTGDVPHISPRPTVSGTPAWSSAYPLVTWYLYEHSGDARILAEHFDHLKAYVDFLGATAKDRILPPDRYGDHLNLTDKNARGDPPLTSTFYYYYDVLLLVRMAEILDRRAEVTRYRALADEIRAAFRRAFFDSGRGIFGAGTQCELTMGLFLELEPPGGARNDVVEKLVYDIQVLKNGHLNTGILGTKYVMELLSREERSDVAWHVATRDDYPSWGHMTHGYTTLSETWQRSGTNNHVMFGSVDAWYYKALAGIRTVVERPGYAHVRIQPYVPADLDWVRAAVATVRGRVASAWRKDGERLCLEVTIPANVTADVVLPSDRIRDGRIAEGQSVVWDRGFRGGVPGLLGGDREEDEIRLQIGSGQYRFECEWINRPKTPPPARPLTRWHSRFVTAWQMARLMPATPVAGAPVVRLADDLAWSLLAGEDFVNMHERCGGRAGLVYLANRFHVDQSGDWILHVGHDGGMRLFVDGMPVAVEPRRVNPAPRLRTAATVRLEAGDHEIVIALDTDDGRAWGLFFSFEIPEGHRPADRRRVFPRRID